jgi:hypothetical protein
MPVRRNASRIALLFCMIVLPPSLRADESPAAADEAICQQAGVPTDGPALLKYFRQRTPSAARSASLAAAVRRLGDRSYRVREQASAELVAAGSMAIPFLQPARKSADLEIATRAQRCLEQVESTAELSTSLAVARLLGVRGPRETTTVVLAYLPFADEDLLEQELRIALHKAGFPDGKPDPLLTKTLQDSSVARRAAAAWVLGHVPADEVRATVRPLLADPDPQVRLRAAQGLIAGKERQAIPALVRLLRGAPPNVTVQAEDELYLLAGDRAPQVSVGAGGDDERRRCQEAWTRWWNEHGREVDLGRLAAQPPQLGLTFLVALDGYGGQGRVWECGRDSKPRWEVRNVRGPIDAQLLPGNRVLVAEYYAHRVSEFDLHGKLLWQYALEGPVSCQRLPNGNTLVANNHVIQEVSSQGKIVRTILPRPRSTVFAAQKLWNGHVVYVTYEGMLVELDQRDKEVRSFPFERPTDGKITFEALRGGHFLIPLSASGQVAEFDVAGKIVWRCFVSHPNSATRLPSGNTVVCSRQDCRVVEVDRSGKAVWELRQEGHLFRVSRR